MAEQQHIPHFQPSCKGIQYDMLQITKSQMMALSMWRANYIKLLQEAQDECGVPHYVTINGVQCHNDIPNFDEHGSAEGSATYEFFKFMGFDDQTFVDLADAWAHDEVEHMHFHWSPVFSMTLADFSDFMLYMNTNVLLRIKSFKVKHKGVRYNEDVFPDDSDRPAKGLFEQPVDLSLMTYHQIKPFHRAYVDNQITGMGQYTTNSYIIDLDDIEFTGQNDLPLVLDKYEKLAVIGLLAVSQDSFAKLESTTKVGEDKDLVGEWWTIESEDEYTIDLIPDFDALEHPKYYLGDEEENYLVPSPYHGQRYAYIYINLVWGARRELVAAPNPTLDPDNPNSSLFLTVGAGYYLNVETFKSTNPIHTIKHVGGFSYIEVEEEEKTFLEKFIGGIFGFIGEIFDLIASLPVISLMLDLQAWIYSKITGEDYEHIREQVDKLFKVLLGVSITLVIGYFAPGAGSVIRNAAYAFTAGAAASAMLVGIFSIAMLSTATALKISQALAIPTQKERDDFIEQQKDIRDAEAEKAKAEAFKGTLGSFEQHAEINELMYNHMFMPLAMLELGSETFGCGSEFEIKYD